MHDIAALGQFDAFAALPAGTFHLILDTPLGSAIIDPFAPGSDGLRQRLESWGIRATVRVGVPTEEELARPSLTSNLALLGLAAGGLALAWLMRRR